MPKPFRLLALLFTACAACVTCTACADLLHGSVELGSQKIRDCVPGSVSRPCE